MMRSLIDCGLYRIGLLGSEGKQQQYTSDGLIEDCSRYIGAI